MFLKLVVELQEDGFGDDKQFQCFVAECEENGIVLSTFVVKIFTISSKTW